MPKKFDRPIVSRHFKFFEEDLEFLEVHFGPRSPKGLSLNEIIRTIVRDSVKSARAKMNEMAEQKARREEHQNG